MSKPVVKTTTDLNQVSDEKLQQVANGIYRFYLALMVEKAKQQAGAKTKA